MVRGLHCRSLLVGSFVSLGLAAHPAAGQCESASTADCNRNGIPDACELAGTLTLQSGPMGPLDNLTSQRYQLSPSPVALADLTVTATARGNLANWTERVDVWINDTPLRSIYLFSTDCDPEATETFMLPATTYMDALAAGGGVALTFVPSAAVDAGFCSQTYVDVQIDLLTLPGADDNHNGVLDECEDDSGNGDTLCQGMTPTIYVNEAGIIVGGPLSGKRFRGVLVGTPGNDVIMGTSANDLLVGAGGDDRICGNGGNDHITREPQGQANGAANGHASGRARGG